LAAFLPVIFEISVNNIQLNKPAKDIMFQMSSYSPW